MWSFNWSGLLNSVLLLLSALLSRPFCFTLLYLQCGGDNSQKDLSPYYHRIQCDINNSEVDSRWMIIQIPFWISNSQFHFAITSCERVVSPKGASIPYVVPDLKLPCLGPDEEKPGAPWCGHRVIPSFRDMVPSGCVWEWSKALWSIQKAYADRRGKKGWGYGGDKLLEK